MTATETAPALTDLETAVLRAWPTNYASAEDEKADNATWHEVADCAKALGKPVKTVRGVIGSLVSKGLVEGGHEKANGVPGELQVLTEAGIDAVFALRAAPAPVTQTAEAPAAAPKAPKVERDRRNGILFPVEGTAIAKCWAVIEAVEAALGRPAKPADLKEMGAAQGLNLTTLGLCLHQRRKFYKAGA